jgi:hypothetical protein
MTSKKNLKIFLASFITFAIVSFFVWPHLPVADSPEYFLFVDQRHLLGIPYFGDVASNIAFLIVGLYTVYLILKNQKQANLYTVFGGIIGLTSCLIFVGSSYFHWLPGTERLFWDRLPMTIAFSAVIALLIGDRLDKKIGRWVGVALIPVGALTVIGWNQNWFSLKPYILLQFGSIIFVLLTAVLSKSGRVTNQMVSYCGGFYVAAKVFEVFDRQIFEVLGFISGHSIKHILAAIAIYKLVGFLKQPHVS